MRSRNPLAAVTAVAAITAPARWAMLVLAGGLSLAACAQPAPPPQPSASESFSAGISFDTTPTEVDLEVPLYPGAKPYKEGQEDKAGVRLSLWGGLFGVDVAASKYQSRDSVDSIARFYRQALSRYGTLLDCSDPDAPRGKKKDKDDGPLTCEDDKPDAGGQLYKVGQKKNFRVVSIKPLTDGTTQFSIARVKLR